MPIGSSSAISAAKPDGRTSKLSAKERFQRAYDKLAFGLKARADFYTAMADFSDAGVAPYAGLNEMLSVARDRWAKKSMVKVYVSIMEKMKTGAGLPTALAPWIPEAEVAMLRGAEQAGPEVLNTTFGELGKLLVRQAKARSKLLSVLGMNVANLIMILAVMVMVIDTLVPVLDKIVTPALAAKMPFAMAYFGISEWVIHYGIFLLIAIIVIGGVLAWALPNWASPHRRWLDLYVPPFSIYQRLHATLFLSTAASMMRAGITLHKVLKDMEEFSSKWMHYHVAIMNRVLAKGQGEVKALAVGPLPNDTADTLRVYRLIPKFQEVMTRLSEANFVAYEKSIDKMAVTFGVFSMFLTTGFGIATTIAMFNFSDAIQASATAAQHVAGG